MGKLPRRIKNPIGFVYVAKGGYYHCGDKDDKERIMALGEILQQAFDDGALTLHDEPRKIAPSSGQTKAHVVLLSHYQQNQPYSEQLDALLQGISLQKKKKVYYISREKLEKILGKDWELELFTGEIVKK